METRSDEERYGYDITDPVSGHRNHRILYRRFRCLVESNIDIVEASFFQPLCLELHNIFIVIVSGAVSYDQYPFHLYTSVSVFSFGRKNSCRNPHSGLQYYLNIIMCYYSGKFGSFTYAHMMQVMRVQRGHCESPSVHTAHSHDVIGHFFKVPENSSGGDDHHPVISECEFGIEHDHALFLRDKF
ncbi:hypothetical protein SDC9_177252 [bioreactor metagenome]|uniref:Uncharacterized protein n=1 Tax=bioreactor metagenome TaxID=1076179 RepID=A0A645GVM1_9ZZZZ